MRGGLTFLTFFVTVRKPHVEAIANIKTNWRASMDDYNNVRVAQLYFYRADDDGNILRDENGNKISRTTRPRFGAG